MTDGLLTSSEDSMLQMEMSAVTEGSVMCNGCLCRDESGNNWPSIDDFYSAKRSACRATSVMSDTQTDLENFAYTQIHLENFVLLHIFLSNGGLDLAKRPQYWHGNK